MKIEGTVCGLSDGLDLLQTRGIGLAPPKTPSERCILVRVF